MILKLIIRCLLNIGFSITLTGMYVGLLYLVWKE